MNQSYDTHAIFTNAIYWWWTNLMILMRHLLMIRIHEPIWYNTFYNNIWWNLPSKDDVIYCIVPFLYALVPYFLQVPSWPAGCRVYSSFILQGNWVYSHSRILLVSTILRIVVSTKTLYVGSCAPHIYAYMCQSHHIHVRFLELCCQAVKLPSGALALFPRFHALCCQLLPAATPLISTARLEDRMKWTPHGLQSGPASTIHDWSEPFKTSTSEDTSKLWLV